MDTSKGRPSRRGAPRPVTPGSLAKAALHYLERYASSSANLKRVLMRRVARAAAAEAGDRAEGERLVDALVERYRRAGLVDDAAYAGQLAASLQRRGTSRRAIRGRLAAKGVAAALVDASLRDLAAEPGGGELAAACALARRRRLGAYRPTAARDAHRQKDMAALARAGFSLDIARRVLAAADAEALEALARGEPE